MVLLLLTFVAFGLVMAAMAVGVIVSDRRLRGSCGGPAILDDDGIALTCPDCGCEAGQSEVGRSILKDQDVGTAPLDAAG